MLALARKLRTLASTRFGGAARRAAIARRHIRGSGIEIGALHNPLRLPRGARVRYVDRMPVEELRRQYPELKGESLVDVDLIDDGERLASVPIESQDFVVANHFLEHCENPVLALLNMFRVLRDGGVLYLAVPDKRFTFDVDRQPTPLGHVLDDYEHGSERSRRGHFEEWARLVDHVPDAELERHVEDLLARHYSIHFHVWTQADVLELLVELRQRFGLSFDVETAIRNGHENIFVLRKLSASAVPAEIAAAV
jgi:predicted SAM-dependent methyltransferase